MRAISNPLYEGLKKIEDNMNQDFRKSRESIFDNGTKNAEKHATRTSERVSDGIRRAVYMNKIATQDMRQHLMLNQSRLSTAEEVDQDIEDYWDATEEFSRDDKNQTGFIAPVGKGPVEGGKPNGVPYNFGKAVAQRAKEKCTKDSDFNPNVVNSVSLVDTAIGVNRAQRSPVLV